MSGLVLRAAVVSPVDAQVQDVPTPTGKADLGQAARQFEGMLMAQIFQTMRKTVQHADLFGDSGLARGTCEYLLDQAVVDHAISTGQGWGLAPRLEAAWKARQNG